MVEEQIRISDPAPYDIRGELKLYRATDYDPSTSDSPCTQRDDVRTANSATAGEPTEATDDLMKYQSVENYETRNPMISWYSCHIIDKSLSKKFVMFGYHFSYSCHSHLYFRFASVPRAVSETWGGLKPPKPPPDAL